MFIFLVFYIVMVCKVYFVICLYNKFHSVRLPHSSVCISLGRYYYYYYYYNYYYVILLLCSTGLCFD